MGYMAVVHELLNDYLLRLYLTAEKSHQIFAFGFRTNLPSRDSFSICRETMRVGKSD